MPSEIRQLSKWPVISCGIYFLVIFVMGVIKLSIPSAMFTIMLVLLVLLYAFLLFLILLFCKEYYTNCKNTSGRKCGEIEIKKARPHEMCRHREVVRDKLHMNITSVCLKGFNSFLHQ